VSRASPTPPPMFLSIGSWNASLDIPAAAICSSLSYSSAAYSEKCERKSAHIT